MTALSDLHPTFYPSPSIQYKDDRGIVRYKDADIDYLTKEHLKDLFDECGNVLHRAPLDKLFPKAPKPRPIDYEEIATHAQKIANLLGLHLMMLLDRETFFVCALNAGPEGKISVAIGVGI